MLPSSAGQTPPQVLRCRQVVGMECPVHNVRRQSDLAAEAIAAEPVVAAGDVQAAPQRAVLGGEDGEVGQRVTLIAVRA